VYYVESHQTYEKRSEDVGWGRSVIYGDPSLLKCSRLLLESGGFFKRLREASIAFQPSALILQNLEGRLNSSSAYAAGGLFFIDEEGAEVYELIETLLSCS